MGKCNMCGMNPCHCDGCGSGHCHTQKSDWHVHTGDMMVDNMAKLADRAWEELVVEKMKVLWKEYY